MEIAFGILSSQEREESVRQLVHSLGDADPVFVHQDLSKQPEFSLAGTHAYLIPDYVKTTWGSAELARAILHLIQTALQRSRFDYFQLLSASCLPCLVRDEPSSLLIEALDNVSWSRQDFRPFAARTLEPSIGS